MSQVVESRHSHLSSNERLTPANEYDIVIDSASNPVRAHMNTLRKQKQLKELEIMAATPSSNIAVAAPLKENNELNMRTARQGLVKTMS